MVCACVCLGILGLNVKSVKNVGIKVHVEVQACMTTYMARVYVMIIRMLDQIVHVSEGSVVLVVHVKRMVPVSVIQATLDQIVVDMVHVIVLAVHVIMGLMEHGATYVKVVSHMMANI